MEKDTSIRSADLDLGFIDLNTANEQDLANIPWIGRQRAQALIRARPLETMDDVRRIPGFSDDIVDDLIRGGATVGKPPR